MALTTQLDILLAFTQTGAALDFGTPSDRVTYRKSFSLADGGGADQASLRFSDQRTLAAGTNEDLDLAGSLAGPFGSTLTFATVKGILVFNHPTNTVGLTVTRPASGAQIFLNDSDGIFLSPGGLFLATNPAAAGWTVTAGTDDTINFEMAAGTGNQIYDVLIWGD